MQDKSCLSRAACLVHPRDTVVAHASHTWRIEFRCSSRHIALNEWQLFLVQTDQVISQMSVLHQKLELRNARAQ